MSHFQHLDGSRCEHPALCSRAVRRALPTLTFGSDAADSWSDVIDRISAVTITYGYVVTLTLLDGSHLIVELLGTEQDEDGWLGLAVKPLDDDTCRVGPDLFLSADDFTDIRVH